MYESASATEDAFYRAFSMGDLEEMMEIWSPNSGVVCIHPSGPRLEGVEDIRKGWELIFEHRLERLFRICSRRVVGSGYHKIHLVEENITIVGTSLVAPPILTTNVYEYQSDRWYMVLHHASTSPVALSKKDEASPKFPQNPVLLH
jgi:ketosteroid isomerase-like protein